MKKCLVYKIVGWIIIIPCLLVVIILSFCQEVYRFKEPDEEAIEEFLYNNPSIKVNEESVKIAELNQLLKDNYDDKIFKIKIDYHKDFLNVDIKRLNKSLPALLIKGKDRDFRINYSK